MANNKKDDNSMKDIVSEDKPSQNIVSPEEEKQVKYVEEFSVIKHEKELLKEEQSTVNTDKQLVAEAKQKVKSNKSKYGSWFVFSVFVLNIFVLSITLYLQSSKFGVANIGSFFDTQYRLRYALFALLVTVMLMILEMFQVYVLLFKATKKSHPFISYKCAAMGKYYGSIMGMATAGKPYQVFYLSSKGFPARVSASVPIVSYTLYQFVFAFVSFIVLVTSFSMFQMEKSALMLTLSIISLIITLFMIIAILFMSLSKRAAPAVAIKFIKLLKKMRIVKNYNRAVNKTTRVLADYRRGMKYLLQNFTTLFVSLFVNVATIVLTAIIPYLIYCMFYIPTDTTFIEIFVKVIICNLAMKYVPLPGGVGIAELSFTVLFANMFTEGTLFWAMLFWRMFAFYGYMLQGLFFLIYDLIAVRIRAKKRTKA